MKRDQERIKKKKKKKYIFRKKRAENNDYLLSTNPIKILSLNTKPASQNCPLINYYHYYSFLFNYLFFEGALFFASEGLQVTLLSFKATEVIFNIKHKRFETYNSYSETLGKPVTEICSGFSRVRQPGTVGLSRW